MKTKLFLFSLLCCLQMGQAENFYSSLLDVNDQWAYQSDIEAELFMLPPSHNPIQDHLLSVHKILKERDVSHLSESLRNKRSILLEELKLYALKAQFPNNLIHPHRQPVFIGPNGNYCAVGHLISRDGRDDLTRNISANTNYYYLKEMNDPEILNWAQQSGFSVEELAWIQPGYPVAAPFQPMMGGTNGAVTSTLQLPDGSLLAVGNFDTAGANYAGGIAFYYSGVAGWDWARIGQDGLAGQVFDILPYQNGWIVAGNFYMADTNYIGSGVAYWDGNTWTGLGNFYVGALVNTVIDIEIYNGDIYAAGFFRSDFGAPDYFANVARWDGNKWVGLGGVPDGTVKALKEYQGNLILAGDFTHIDTVAYAHIAAYNPLSGFSQLNQGLPTPVNALEVVGDTLFAGGKLLSWDKQDTAGLTWFHNNSWTVIDGLSQAFNLDNQEVFCLESTPYGLFVGGNIIYSPVMGNYGKNIMRLTPQGLEPYGILDSTVYSLNFQNGHLYMGGEFTDGYKIGGNPPLNHITYTNLRQQFSIDDHQTSYLQIFPNPTADFIEISYFKNLNTEEIKLLDISGRSIHIDSRWDAYNSQLDCRNLPSGIYTLIINSETSETRKLIIE